MYANRFILINVSGQRNVISARFGAKQGLICILRKRVFGRSGGVMKFRHGPGTCPDTRKQRKGSTDYDNRHR